MKELYKLLANSVIEDCEIRPEILFGELERKKREEEETNRLENKEW